MRDIKIRNLTYNEKLSALRTEIKKRRLDGFVVPRMSEFQGEFVAPYAERLAWLTGFTGSAGGALVLADKACVMTDGRYTIQLAQQADKKLYEFADSQKISAAKWLGDNAKEGQVIGYDPWLHPVKQVEDWQKSLAEKGVTLSPVDGNPVDGIWTARPAPPQGRVEIFPEKIAGATGAEKRKKIADVLKQKKIHAAFLSLPDSAAWLLNVRGADVEFTPVPLSFALVFDDASVKWFIDPEKISPEVKNHIGKDVEAFASAELEKHIGNLKGRVVGLDFTRSPSWFRQRLEKAGAVVRDFTDPCIEPKAIKTQGEQDAIRAAHIRDGAAMVNFLCWLEENGKSGKLTELGVTAKLEEFRAADKSYRGPSFATIAGWNANGAIVHYRADEKTNAAIKPPGILLLDSGGQYAHGTTDITRTVAIGKPAEEVKEKFTLVLKGHIAVARAKFPEGTPGAQIDALARQALWRAGLDYAHGTGHGVGCFLSVHEEAASLSPRGREGIKAGMLLSNEPGYYKEGAYGIRIENLVLAKSEDSKMLDFETVTFVPIDRNLVKAGMLETAEKEWLNAYHAAVFKKIGPLVDEKVRAWLAAQIQPL